MAVSYFRKQKINMPALGSIAKFLFYILILDFTMEGLDQIHRIYEAEESFEILYLLVHGPLFLTLFVFQIFLGTIVPLVSLGILQLYTPNELIRRIIYLTSSVLVLVGIFFMRYNVVIGGQLFSKSFYGFTAYKVRIAGSEGLLLSLVWIVVPFIILAFLLWLLPPWKKTEDHIQKELP